MNRIILCLNGHCQCLLRHEFYGHKLPGTANLEPLLFLAPHRTSSPLRLRLSCLPALRLLASIFSLFLFSAFGFFIHLFEQETNTAVAKPVYSEARAKTTTSTCPPTKKPRLSCLLFSNPRFYDTDIRALRDKSSAFPRLSTMAPSAATSTATKTAKGSKASAKGPSTSEKESKGANKQDFFWTYTEEPHRTRRQAIIKKHPEVH